MVQLLTHGFTLMTSELAQEVLVNILANTAAKNIYFKNIEIIQYGNINCCNIFLDKSSQIISEEVFSGFSSSLEIATLKAISEFIERNAFKLQVVPKAKEMVSTDGMAAYPICNSFAQSLEICKRISFAEAVERYSWAMWWDNSSFYHTSINPNDIFTTEYLKQYIEYIKTILPLEELIIINPVIQSEEYETYLIFYKIKGMGYLSGGASGWKMEKKEIYGRALSELLRHALAFYKILNNSKYKIESFYEKRLFFFASGSGNNLVKARLNAQGNTTIPIPLLDIDEEIDSLLPENYIVYHSHFVNQPLFLGGALERFCI